jgi:hypothetical protein
MYMLLFRHHVGDNVVVLGWAFGPVDKFGGPFALRRYHWPKDKEIKKINI